MKLHHTSQWHPFYGESSQPLVIDANPFQKLDICTGKSQERALAISTGFDSSGSILAYPLRRGLGGANESSRAIGESNTSPSAPLEAFLLKNLGSAIMLDVAGTSPKLVESIREIILDLNCAQRMCCGSRFDTVGESLAQCLPEALHFMPRAARARLTLNLVLDSKLPDVAPFSVINLPVVFEGIRIVTTSLIQRMRRMGIYLNVIPGPNPEAQHKLAQMDIDAIIVNLENSHSRNLNRTQLSDGTMPTMSQTQRIATL